MLIQIAKNCWSNLTKIANLTNICSKISKIEMNLRMIWHAIWKALESTKGWKKVNHFAFTLQWNVLQNHERSVVVLEHFWNFKGIWLIVEYNTENDLGGNTNKYLSSEKEIFFEIKKKES